MRTYRIGAAWAGSHAPGKCAEHGLEALEVPSDMAGYRSYECEQCKADREAKAGQAEE